MKSYPLLLVTALLLFSCTSDPNRPDALLEDALDFAATQLEKTVIAVNDSTKFPRTTDENNQWISKPARDWTAGFFPGALWLMYEATNKAQWKEWAEKWTAGMYDQQFNDGTHDTGFMMYCSYGNGYRLAPKEDYKKVLLQTAETLCRRFNPVVGCIKSWDWMKPVEEFPYPVIIDNMMNLELLFWATKAGGDQKYDDIAVKHADTTLKNHIRENNSTWHVLQYDPETGAVLKKHTHQGYADESAWARGQAWGLYGYTVCYRETGEKRFLDTAKALANFFIDNLPEDFVPYWDFDAPDIPDEERDTSAGAIAASALLELSTFCDVDEKDKYWNAGVQTLKSLAGPNYLAKGTDNPAILLHAVGSKPGNSEIDVPLIYGDYYFIEGLLRYKSLK